MKYDLIVIGGGPGGYTGAIRAAKLGMRVALIEQRDLGGTCLNRGCIPTKALLHSSELYKSRTEWEELGIKADNVTLDEAKIYSRKDAVVASLRSGIENLIKANKIDLFKARGWILDKHTVMAGEEKLETEHILIATGSRPAGFDPSRPIVGIENALSSDDVLAAPIIGENIIIIGAGVIGIELSSYYAGIGKSVTILATGDRIIKMMSKDMSNQLSALLKKNGVKIILNAKINKVTAKSVEYDTGGDKQEISGDVVITAVGRNANVENLGLENVGITTGKNIKVDGNMNTGVDNIYACGDVTGGIQLAHYAAACAITAIESMKGMKHSIDLSVVPSCIYTTPEIAAVGRKDDEVENAKIGKFMMGGNGKSIIEGINRGFIKVIGDENGTVVGAEIFASRGTDIVGELALSISAKMKLHDVSGVIHAHPTVYEAIAEAFEDIDGFATHMLPKRK